MKRLKELVADLNRLFEAAALLEGVWAHTDPYDNNLPKHLDRGLKKYFDWDDSE